MAESVLDEAAGPRIEARHELDVLDHFGRNIESSKDFCSSRWDLALEHQRFVSPSGEHQWDVETARKRRELGQPVFSINDIALAANAFAGKGITARFQPTTIPRSQEDGPWANILAEAIRSIRDRCFAEQVESDKFRDLGIEGYAAVEWYEDFLENIHGQVKAVGCDLWELIWDASAKMPCLIDREWDARGRWISIDEYLALFPGERDAALEGLNVSTNGWITEPTTISRWPWLYRIEGKYVNPRRREIFLVDYQWREREPWYLIQLAPSDEEMNAAAATGGTAAPTREEVGEDRYLAIRDLYEFEVSTGKRNSSPPKLPFIGPRDGLYRWRYKSATIAGERVIREQDIPQKKFTRIYTTGIPFKQSEGTSYHGFVEYMKDPQRFQNSMISLGVSYLQRGPKGPMFYEPDTFVDADEAGKLMAQPFATIPLKRGGKAKLEFGPTLPFPDFISEFSAIADRAVWRPVGMNPTSLGQVDDPRRVSGTAYDSIIAAGDKALSIFFDTLRLSRRLTGQLLLAFIKDWEPQDLADIVGPEKAALIPPPELWEEMMDRDIIVEEVLSTKSEQEAAWDYGSRQGTWEKLMMGQIMPPQIFVELMPSGWLPAEKKALWLQYLDARFPMVPPTPPGGEGGEGGEAEGGAPQPPAAPQPPQ